MDTEFLSLGDIVLRLGVAFIAGSVLGLERSLHRQVAGLRTHILICTGSTLLMLLSIWMPQKYQLGDPGRIAAQVVSGIGFLGAGAILRLGNNVKGLTTAASLWVVAAIGLALGAGLFAAAGITMLLGLITLVALSGLENRFFPNVRNKLIELSFSEGLSDTTQIKDILRQFRIHYQTMDLDHSSGGTLRVRMLVGVPDSADIAKLTQTLEKETGALRAEIKEKY